MDAVDGAHRLADLAGLEGHGGLHEGLLHLVGLEPAQIALVGLGGGILALGFSRLGEVLSGQQLGPEVQGLGHGLLDLGVGFGLEQDMTGLQFDELALAGIEHRLHGRVVRRRNGHARGSQVDVVDHPPGSGLETGAGRLQERFQFRRAGIGHLGRVRRHGDGLEAEFLAAHPALQVQPRIIHRHLGAGLLEQLLPGQPAGGFQLHLLEAHALLAEGIVDLGAGPQAAVLPREPVLAQPPCQGAPDFRVGDDDAVARGQFLDQLVVHQLGYRLGLDEGLEFVELGILAQALDHVPHGRVQVAPGDVPAVDPGDQIVRSIRIAVAGRQIGHHSQQDDHHDDGHGRLVAFEYLAEIAKHENSRWHGGTGWGAGIY